MNSIVVIPVRTSLSLFTLLIFTMVFSFNVRGAGEVDTSFTASMSIPDSGAAMKALGLPDGKFLVSGSFTNIGGVPSNNVIKFFADGKVDADFKSPLFTQSDGGTVWINEMAVQSNGKVLVHGLFDRVNGEARSTLVRLNTDGSLDTTFPNIFPSGSYTSIYKIHVFPDDSFLICGSFTISAPNGTRSYLVKFNADGVLDTSFSSYADKKVVNFAVQPDGKIVVGWTFIYGDSSRVNRLNGDGTLDSTFAPITLASFYGEIGAMTYLPGGKILVGGDFTLVNGVSRRGIVRVNPDGSIDPTFTVSNIDYVRDIVLEPSGKYYVSGLLNYNSFLQRLNSDGTRDTSFAFSNTATVVGDVYLQPDGNLIVPLSYGNSEPIIRVRPNGGRDYSFDAAAYAPGKGFAVYVQPDDKILVGGRFSLVNRTSLRYGITRFNANGTVDTSFQLGNGVSPGSQVYDIAMQPDGKILFTCEGSEAKRLNPNGSLDIIYPNTRSFWDIESLPDGKVLIGGPTLRRYNSNGTLDATLATVTNGGINPTVYGIAVQPDGKIIIVGNFITVNGASRNRITRLNADGTFDNSFNASGANADIYTVALQSDGKILIGGSFTAFNSDASKKYLARLNSDGTLDTSFSANADSPILDVKLQSNGKILIGGSMSAVNGAARRGIAKLSADGSLDASFNTGTGANSTVWGIDQQSDGKIIYVGEFYRTNGFETLGIGRLFNSLQNKLFDFDGDNRSDIGVFRPGSNIWYQLIGPNYQFSSINFGASGDILAPADYDGDGKTDLGIFRPSSGTFWYAATSQGGAFRAVQWGQSGDIPLPSDIDGDGKADFVVYRPSNSTWYRLSSAGVSSQLNFGQSGDKPLIGDFDGDGKTDYAIYRPSTGAWWYAASSASNAFRAIQWGASEDIPVPADYDGDGKTDTAVFRPSNGAWYILNSGNGTSTSIQFGLSGDKPVAADYDGDGKADIAVYRPSNGGWYIMRSTAGFLGLEFGISGDTAISNAFVP